MHLLTEWEGQTGKYLARGQDVWTERRETVRPDREPNIFTSGPPTQSISTFYHVTNLRTSSFIRSVDFLSVLSV